LGPLLLIIYINDLVDSCDANLFLFANGAKIFQHINNTVDVLTLQNKLDKFTEWTDKWLVKLNVGKCKNMSVCHKGQGDTITPVYNIKGVALENVDSYKYQGVTDDSHLKFDKHISEKVNKAYMMLGILRRNFKDVSCECFLNLYKTMVRPLLEYTNSIWSPRRVCDLTKIEKVQMKATKYMCRGKDLSYDDRLRSLKLPTLNYRRIPGDMIELYKIITGKYDSNCSLQLYLRSKLVHAVTRGNGSD